MVTSILKIELLHAFLFVKDWGIYEMKIDQKRKKDVNMVNEVVEQNLSKFQVRYLSLFGHVPS